jgi:hypothetical protein
MTFSELLDAGETGRRGDILGKSMAAWKPPSLPARCRRYETMLTLSIDSYLNMSEISVDWELREFKGCSPQLFWMKRRMET